MYSLASLTPVYDYNVNVRAGQEPNSHAHWEKKDQERSGRESGGTYNVLKVGYKVIAVLILLQTSKGHLCSGDVLNPRRVMHSAFGILLKWAPLTFLGFSRYSKRVPSSQTIPLLTLAAVYE